MSFLAVPALYHKNGRKCKHHIPDALCQNDTELYNAINGTAYPWEELEITTLKDAIHSGNMAESLNNLTQNLLRIKPDLSPEEARQQAEELLKL